MAEFSDRTKQDLYKKAASDAWTAIHRTLTLMDSDPDVMVGKIKVMELLVMALVDESCEASPQSDIEMSVNLNMFMTKAIASALSSRYERGVLKTEEKPYKESEIPRRTVK